MRKRHGFLAVTLAWFLLNGFIAEAQQTQDSLKRKQRLAAFADESRIDEFLFKLSAKYHPQNFVIENVTVISMIAGRAVPNQSVVVKDGRIQAVGPLVRLSNPAGRI